MLAMLRAILSEDRSPPPLASDLLSCQLLSKESVRLRNERSIEYDDTRAVSADLTNADTPMTGVQMATSKLPFSVKKIPKDIRVSE